MADDRSVLLLGGSGQVGREIRELAWPSGWTVHAPPRAVLDIADRTSLISTIRSQPWTAVVNAAAYTAVDKAETDRDAAWRINAQAPELLAAESARQGIPLVHISTDYVFDGSAHRPYVEGDVPNPLGAYGKSKLAGEEAIRAHNPQHLIVRTSWVFGRYGGNFVKTMLRLAGQRPTLRVVDDQTGTPTAAGDLANVLGRLVQRAGAREGPWGTYHFANEGSVSWCDFARIIFKMSAAHGGPTAEVTAISTKDYPTVAPRPANSALSTRKISRDFDVHPRPFEDALDDVLKAIATNDRR